MIEIRSRDGRVMLHIPDRISLSEADLMGLDLRNADLREKNMMRTSLRGAKLRNASLLKSCLIGADLSEADLTGADLRFSDLATARFENTILTGANLFGASLMNTSIVDGGQRSDDYHFFGWILHGALRINAGCRNFTLEQARAHWQRTRGGTKLGDETMLILDYIERMARVRGLIK